MEQGATAPGLPPGGQARRLVLNGGRGIVGRCRDFTREALTDWGWLPTADEEQSAVVEDVLLLVSEVITNACLHAGGPQELVLHCTEERLRIEVTDASPVHPAPRKPVPSLPGGHGLHVVQRLSRGWGAVPNGSGKTVWLEVASPKLSASEG